MNSPPPLVLLPGMMCDARVWRAQCDALAGDCDPIVVADLTQSDSIEGLARDALQQAPPCFALAGLSLGGIVAFECWRRAPERITHLALIDTNPFAEKSERQALRGGEVERARQGELRAMMVDGFKPAYLGSRARSDEALQRTILDMAMDLGAAVFERQSLALRDRPDSADTLPTIDSPTAVVCGEEDVLCPVRYHEHMAGRIPDAELAVLEGCGHLAPMEAPARVNDLLRRLVRR